MIVAMTSLLNLFESVTIPEFYVILMGEQKKANRINIFIFNQGRGKRKADASPAAVGRSKAKKAR
jgi:hypothetical protein